MTAQRIGIRCLYVGSRAGPVGPGGVGRPLCGHSNKWQALTTRENVQGLLDLPCNETLCGNPLDTPNGLYFLYAHLLPDKESSKQRVHRDASPIRDP
jgi:hypothetical protein